MQLKEVPRNLAAVFKHFHATCRHAAANFKVFQSIKPSTLLSKCTANKKNYLGSYAFKRINVSKMPLMLAFNWNPS